jgi:hypothetical protein
MKTLQQAMRVAFRPPRTDPHRRAREEGKRLASEHGICLEKLPGGGMNVWPPAHVTHDPFEGDHYAQDWPEVLEHVRAYLAAQAA